MHTLKRYDEDGQVLGALEWQECPGRTFEVHIDVNPTHHRKGIGRSMMEELLELVKDRNPMCLYTFMAGDNELAQKFFRGIGFTLYHIPSFYGHGRDAYFGCKPIGEPK